MVGRKNILTQRHRACVIKLIIAVIYGHLAIVTEILSGKDFSVTIYPYLRPDDRKLRPSDCRLWPNDLSYVKIVLG